MVPRADGTPPPSWPNAFERYALIHGAILVVDALLTDCGLPHGAPIMIPVHKVAQYTGTMLA